MTAAEGRTPGHAAGDACRHASRHRLMASAPDGESVATAGLLKGGRAE